MNHMVIKPAPSRAQTPIRKTYRNVKIDYESMRGFPQAQSAVENVAADLEKVKHLSYYFSLTQTFDRENRKIVGRVDVASKKTPQRSRFKALKLIAQKNNYNPIKTFKDFIYIHIPHWASTADLTEQGIASAAKRARRKAATFREPLGEHLRNSILAANRVIMH